MCWCLQVKLAQNYRTFRGLLGSTKTKDIVEDSHKDRFWGAVRDKEDPKILRGCNVLGKLLVELREVCVDNIQMPSTLVQPLEIPDFKLYGQLIQI